MSNLKTITDGISIRNVRLIFLYVALPLSLIFIYVSSKSFERVAVKQQVKASISNGFFIASEPTFDVIKINFQDETTSQPPGWLKDFGEPFSTHSGTTQGLELMYGWKNVETQQPLDMTGNGRARIEPEDVLLSTLIHMQADDINGLRYGPFDGVKTEGYWELKLRNGVYKVTVATGDGSVHKAKEVDCINVEGVPAIKDFVPFGKLRSPGRFKTNTVTVTVNDGFLTLDAKGGINTKLCYVEVEPLTIFPYAYILPKQQDMLVVKGAGKDLTVPVVVKNSLDINAEYKVSAEYEGDAKDWLSFPKVIKSGDSVLVCKYAKTASLKAGTYYARLNLSADGFNQSRVTLRVRVVDGKTPYVISSSPHLGECLLNNASISAGSISVPAVKGFKGGVDNATINDHTVQLFKVTSTGVLPVRGTVQGTGGGDAISFTPLTQLEPSSVYKFVITSGVKSYSGAEFTPYETTFYTAATAINPDEIINAEFVKIPIPGTQKKKYTSLTFGPDGRFYALRIDGGIERFEIDHSTGLLKNVKQINTLTKKYGAVTAIGLAFEPSSTKENMVAWVSYSSAGEEEMPMFDGRISRLSGNALQNEDQAIINLPRSTRDHMVNSIAFGPDGGLYVSVGSNTSAGMYDKGWQRDETLLAGSILRLDIPKLNKYKWPLNVRTTSNQRLINKAPANSIAMADGTYNPYSVVSPLTIYASGIRNAYDLVWHSNGQLYVPANGSGGGGNSPKSVKGTRRPDNTFYNGPDVEMTNDVPVQRDWLFRINPDRGIGYFGHPNPLRGEYVINRGRLDNPVYKQKVVADANYRGAAFDFGFNKSPNGAIEYKSDSFNGQLKGKLLVCRFSGGGDIMVLEPGAKQKVALTDVKNDSIYDISKTASGAGNYGLEGMGGFANPIDIVEDTLTGNLYVSEFNWNDNPNLISQITLLKVNQKKVQNGLLAKNRSLNREASKKVTD
ncbi:PQQ-dependent sugar dehydrogenase [Mucilaginibacter sp. JRF]|uniref:PQQ-dependent sugar dehydrogenase n=1 Tax=Mucilaginibacter sp. JRF TaxID=2780088 RepID=UPI00187F6269|nr:PQQ-dependent sugar dehydrogenase [Mucilaginibacter sp. JRF]MBE9585868.1 PQQ-dependent sugar dehydrogenase [Mucilaginibacter sp. JRF]